MLVWALRRLGEWRALLSEEAAERDLGEIVGATQRGRYGSSPCQRGDSGGDPLEGSPHSGFKGVMHDPYSCKFTN